MKASEFYRLFTESVMHYGHFRVKEIGIVYGRDYFHTYICRNCTNGTSGCVVLHKDRFYHDNGAPCTHPLTVGDIFQCINDAYVRYNINDEIWKHIENTPEDEQYLIDFKDLLEDFTETQGALDDLRYSLAESWGESGLNIMDEIIEKDEEEQ